MIGISIIIPVYNVETYLHRCLESIVQQTFKNIEILLIDDCSSDGSFTIMSEFAEADNRIKLFRNDKNKGVGATRNMGISKANGKYLLFIDSDDWIDLRACERLFSIAETNQLEILEGKMKLYRGGNIILKKPFDIDRLVVCETNQYLSSNDFIPNVCNKLWLRTFVVKEKLSCLEGRYFEDNLMALNGILKAKRIAKISYPFYFYNKANLNSITNSVNEKLLYDRLYQIEYMEKMVIGSKDKQIKNHLEKILLSKIQPSLGYLRRYKGNNKKIEKSLLEKISEVLNRKIFLFINESSVPFLKKILICLSPNLYVFIFRIVDRTRKLKLNRVEYKVIKGY